MGQTKYFVTPAVYSADNAWNIKIGAICKGGLLALVYFLVYSGNKNHIEFMDSKGDGNRYNFHIPSIGYKGYFLFEPASGDLRLISFNNDNKHSVSININEIELLDVYSPKIEKDDFEVIDLRG